MIKFFRRIRQKLIGQGNLRRYMAYAFGEILLVVVGILIALQINNWNENRKSRLTELNTLKDIKTSLSSDINSIDFNISMTEQKLASLNLIKKEIKLDKALNDSIKIAFGRSLQEYYFNYAKGPYETLKSKGLSLISNETVRESIINIYESDYQFIEKNENDMFIKDAFFQEYCTTLFDNVAFPDKIEPNVYYYREIVPHDFESLKEDKLYNTLINTKISQSEYVINFVFIRVKGSVEKTIQKLDNEIERLR